MYQFAVVVNINVCSIKMELFLMGNCISITRHSKSPCLESIWSVGRNHILPLIELQVFGFLSLQMLHI